MTASRRLLLMLGFALFAASSQAVAQGLAASRGDSPRRVESVTELYAFGGLHIATNHTSVELGPHSYAVTTDVQSSGLASFFVDLKTHSEARGLIIRGQLEPRSYRGEVHRNGDDSYTLVDHHKDGNVTAASEPAASSFNAERTLIDASIDQLTAFLMVERKVAQGRSCAADLPVFDGRHLYTLHFRDGGPAAPDSNGVTAPIRVCRMQRQAIAGFADAAGHSEGVYQAVLYYAPLAGDDIAVPLRMALWTEFGRVSGRLARLRVDGVKWHISQ